MSKDKARPARDVLWEALVFPYGTRAACERALESLPAPLQLALVAVVLGCLVALLLVISGFVLYAAGWMALSSWNRAFGLLPPLVWGLAVGALFGAISAGFVAPRWRRSYGTSGRARRRERSAAQLTAGFTACAAWTFFETQVRGDLSPAASAVLHAILAVCTLDIAAAALTGFSAIESLFRPSGAPAWRRWQVGREAREALEAVKDGEIELEKARHPPRDSGADFREPDPPADPSEVARLTRELVRLKKRANRAHLVAGRPKTTLPFPSP